MLGDQLLVAVSSLLELLVSLVKVLYTDEFKLLKLGL